MLTGESILLSDSWFGYGEMEYETYYVIPNSIGTTRVITTKGRAGNLSTGLITPFNLEEWKDYFRREHGASPETEELIRKQEEELWPTLTQYGTDIHEVIDATFKGVEYVRTSETKITDDQIAEVKAYAERLMSDLKKKHGATCEFYTEFAFKSKYLTEEMKAELGIDGYTVAIDFLYNMLGGKNES